MANMIDVQRGCGELVPGFWDELAAMLGDAELFTAFWKGDPYEVKRLWAALEDNSELRVIEAYSAAIEEPEAGIPYGPGLIDLLMYRDHFAEAGAICVTLVERLRLDGDLPSLQAALSNWYLLDDPSAAIEERERICREIGCLDGLQDVLRDRALERFFEWDADGCEADARRLMQEKRRICRETKNLRGLEQWAHAKAWMLYCEGYSVPLMRLLALQERISRDIGELDDLCICLMDQSRRLRGKADSRPQAWTCLDEAEEICRDVGRRALLLRVRGEKGVLALAEGDEARAERFLREARPAPLPRGGRGSLEFDLEIAVDLHDAEFSEEAFPRGALDVYQMIDRLARRLGDVGAVQWALGGLVRAVGADDAQAALDLCAEREVICRHLGRVDALVKALGQRAQILVAAGKPANAVVPLREQAELCRGIEGAWRLTGIDRARRDALRAALRGCADLDAALSLHRELELVCRGLGDRARASRAVRSSSRVLRKLGRGPKAPLPMNPGQLSLNL